MTIEDPSLSTYGYQLLPLATSVSKWVIIGKLMYQTYFELFYSFVGGGELMTIEDSLLSGHGYQLLPLTTSQ